ncbi:unnamed protein product [Cuscuta campestris]|uniref:WPP domain-containing protein n=1 Tax=Cuscuta campestris TaxID=132261 RepID=A0A484K4T4_9ASTE|nr:unnamed protein product [Cuscuta campestris]
MEVEGKCSASQPVEESETVFINTNSEKLVGGIDDNEAEGNRNHSDEQIDELIESKGVTFEATEEAVKKPASEPARKGYGLKKWRRIRRGEVRNEGDNIVDGSAGIVKRGLPASSRSSAKSVHLYGGTSQRSDETVSSPNEFVSNLGLFDKPVDFYDHAFVAGADSENSEEDSSSKSSTAASAPNKKMMVNFSRRNSGASVQNKGRQRMAGIETSKKHRAERFKTEKENSYSSLESDSRSSNFVFMQGKNCLKSNETKGENRDAEDLNCGGKASVDLQAIYNEEGNRGEFEDTLQEGLSAESTWEEKDDKNENQDSSSSCDPAIESIFKLQAAQEALKKEVQKLKEIATEDILVDFSSQDGSEALEFTSVGPNHFPIAAQLFQSDRYDGLQTGTTVQLRTHMETELENLFREKIEAEVEVLVSKAAAADQRTLLEAQKALASEQAEMANKLRNAERKAAMLKDKQEKLQSYCENMIDTADGTLRLQKRAFKHAFCFFLQLVLLAIVVGWLKFRLSNHHGENEVVVPT